jgi:uncharacterized protein with LGFP repeats
VTAVYDVPGGGKGQDYVNGSIFWSPQTGARAVRGTIAAHYREMGGPTGILGYPITDEMPTPGNTGWYSHFSRPDGASIYFSNGSGAHAIYGGIRAKWAELNWELGPLGFPTTDETPTPDGIGRYNHFSRADGGSIYSSPSTGSHAIYGGIRAKWAALNWELGPLGYPATDELPTPDGIGRYNHFSRADGASIYSSPSTGSHAIYGSIRAKWASLGWENSRLRYPTSDEYGVSVGRRNDFTGGTATFVNSANSVQVVYR